MFASSHLCIDSLPCCFPAGKWLKRITSGVSKTEGQILIGCTSAQFLWLKHRFVTAEKPPKREDCNYSCIIMPFPTSNGGLLTASKDLRNTDKNELQVQSSDVIPHNPWFMRPNYLPQLQEELSKKGFSGNAVPGRCQYHMCFWALSDLPLICWGHTCPPKDFL